MSLSDVNTAMAAATAALDAADYDTAIAQGIKAQGLLAAIPDSGKETRSMTWDRNAIDQFIEQCRTERNRSLSASRGVQRTKITRVAISD